MDTTFNQYGATLKPSQMQTSWMQPVYSTILTTYQTLKSLFYLAKFGMKLVSNEFTIAQTL